MAGTCPSCMDTLMTSHTTLPLKLLSAVAACVRLLAGVQTVMSLKIRFSGKRLIASFMQAGVNFDGLVGEVWGHDESGCFKLSRGDYCSVTCGRAVFLQLRMWRRQKE